MVGDVTHLVYLIRVEEIFNSLELGAIDKWLLIVCFLAQRTAFCSVSTGACASHDIGPAIHVMLVYVM